MKKHITTILLVLVFVVGLSVLLYPTFSDYVNSMSQSRAMAGYSKSLEQLDRSEYIEILDKAAQYNKQLPAKANRFHMTEEELTQYKSLLRVAATDVIGLIEVPTIDVKLPIYHGTNEAVLQLGVGHMEGTSLPVGGPGTHAALSGHRGLPSAKLFSNLDRVAIGDVFIITVLGEILTYQVDQILTVEPAEVDGLAIVDGADYATLVTCTPYGINSHRLLIRGFRTNNAIPDTIEMIPELTDAEYLEIPPIVIALVILILVIMILLIFILIYMKRKGRS